VLRRFSLTTRLTVIYTLVSALVLLGMAWIIAMTVSRHFEELDGDTLQDKIHLIQGIVAKATSPIDLRERLEDSLQNHPGLYVQIDDQAGASLFASSAFRFPDWLVRPPAGLSLQAVTTWRDGEQEYRALSALVPRHDPLGGDLRVWAALDTHHHADFIRSLQTTLWTYLALAAMLSGLLGWWVARTGLAPLRAMKTRAQAVTAHKLDERMPAEAVPIEMADLAESLNDMLARLQKDFQRLSEFSSDLAHELRTPISNLMTQTQVALSQPRNADTYRDILASNAEEFQRLARMVSDMLLLAKAEHGLLLPSAEDISLAAEAQALFDFYEALADEKGVSLNLTGEGYVKGDRLMLRRAISNLLSNALRYTPMQGQVRVEIGTTGALVSLSVENTGAEISPELLPRLFDRFFRADKSRSHPDSDGAGLGLSITRAIVQAHGGVAAVSSFDGKTRFTLSFPAR
jgi:two-component system heavy metal sensor histidine kinase CusS